jgi:hypothetical protein
VIDHLRNQRPSGHRKKSIAQRSGRVGRNKRGRIVATAAFKFGSATKFETSARVRITATVQELLLKVGALPIALPRINFPDLDLSRLAPTTSFQVPGLPTWLRRLNQQVTITSATPIALAVDAALNWSTSPTTTLNITFGSGSPQIVITNFAASGHAGQITVQGTVQPTTNSSQSFSAKCFRSAARSLSLAMLPLRGKA